MFSSTWLADFKMQTGTNYIENTKHCYVLFEFGNHKKDIASVSTSLETFYVLIIPKENIFQDFR